MSVKTFVGSCHCGHVRFEADIDIDHSTSQCHCSVCTKMRFRGAVVKPAAFRLLSGRAVLTDYRFNSESVHHPFCKYCGVHSFAHGNVEAAGGEFYSVNLACLDEPAARTACPSTYLAAAQAGCHATREPLRSPG
jgi:hypothetical protein